jgi:tetratricopeptide (TPR) repeat protein
VSDGPNRFRFPGDFKLEVDPERVDEALKTLRARVEDGLTAGRFTKVRISFRGKAIGPDVPLALFLAGEGAAFWLTGGLATLLVNLGAKAVLDVSFIHEADELVQEGLALYLDGEIEAAEAKYRKALDRRPDDPTALYNLGVLLRVSGRRDEARATLRRASMGPEGHPDVVKAAEALGRME